LVQEREVLSATGPWLVKGFKYLTEAEGAVIQCEAAGGAVVTVEIALAVTNPDPVRDQGGKAAAEFPREHQDFCGSIEGLINNAVILPINQVQYQLLEFFKRTGMLLLSGPATKEFKLAHPNE
jgi:hypothetical protein